MAAGELSLEYKHVGRLSKTTSRWLKHTFTVEAEHLHFTDAFSCNQRIPLARCVVATPRTRRPGQPFTFRINLNTESQLARLRSTHSRAHKLVLAAHSLEERSKWVEVLSAAGAKVSKGTTSGVQPQSHPNLIEPIETEQTALDLLRSIHEALPEQRRSFGKQGISRNWGRARGVSRASIFIGMAAMKARTRRRSTVCHTQRQAVERGWNVCQWVEGLDAQGKPIGRQGKSAISLEVARALTSQVSVDPERASAAALEFVTELGREDDHEKGHENVRKALEKSDLLDKLAAVIYAGAQQLADVHSSPLPAQQTRPISSDKFSGLHYGRIAERLPTLEDLVGRPDPNLFSQMAVEHLESKDSDEWFTSQNHGIRTTPSLEWKLVVEPSLLQAGRATELLPSDQLAPHTPTAARKLTSLAEFEAGEMMSINRRLKLSNCKPMLREELIGGRLYTGPMYTHYNQILRDRVREAELKTASSNGQLTRQGSALECHSHSQASVLDNTYTTTLHVINSCVARLARLTQAVPVYRGVSGVLPEYFDIPDEKNLRGGIEAAFMSCSTDQTVALDYLHRQVDGSKVLFEAQLGVVSRGADLSWLSQYPKEKEILFPPLTAIEVVSFRVEGTLQVIEARFSVTPGAARTIDEVVHEMQRSHLQLLDLILADLKTTQCPSRPLAGLVGMRLEASQRPPDYFNRAENYMKATEDALTAQEAAMRSLANRASWEDEGAAEEDALETSMRMWKCAEACVRAGHALTASDLLMLSVEAEHEDESHSASIERMASSSVRTVAKSVAASVFLSPPSSRSPILVEPTSPSNWASGKCSFTLQDEVEMRCKALVRIVANGLKQPWPAVAVELVQNTPADMIDSTIELLGNPDLRGSRHKDSLLAEERALWVPGKEVLFYDEVHDKSTSAHVLSEGVKRVRREAGWVQCTIERVDKPTATDTTFTLKRGLQTFVVTQAHQGRLVAVCESGVSAMLRAAAHFGSLGLVAALLDAQVSPYSVDASGTSALHCAAQGGHAEVCRLLSDGRSDWRRLPNLNGQNAYMLAVSGATKAHLDVRRTFRPSPSDKDVRGWEADGQLTESERALMLAAVAGSIKDIDAILGAPDHLQAGAPDVNVASSNGVTPLMLAARGRHNIAVSRLLEYRADAQMKSKSGCTALWMAAEEGASDGLLIQLMSKAKETISSEGTNEHAPRVAGVTPLIVAASNGHCGACKCLISNGARIDEKKKDGGSVLMAACKHGDVATVAFLVEEGADVEDDDVAYEFSGDFKGATALHWASRNGHANVVAKLLTSRWLAKVRDRHAVINAASRQPGSHPREGVTALMLASEFGFESTVRELVRASPKSVTFVDSTGWTALMLACKHDHEGVVRALLQARASLEILSVVPASSAPLALAATGDEYQQLLALAATILPSSGAPDQTTPISGPAAPHILVAGMTPMMIASKYGSLRVVDTIKENVRDHVILVEDGKSALPPSFGAWDHGREMWITAWSSDHLADTQVQISWLDQLSASFQLACSHGHMEVVEALHETIEWMDKVHGVAHYQLHERLLAHSVEAAQAAGFTHIAEQVQQWREEACRAAGNLGGISEANEHHDSTATRLSSHALGKEASDEVAIESARDSFVESHRTSSCVSEDGHNDVSKEGDRKMVAKAASWQSKRFADAFMSSQIVEGERPKSLKEVRLQNWQSYSGRI